MKALSTPINKLIGIKPEPKLIFVRPNIEIQIALNSFRVFLREVHTEPTNYEQLVTGDSHFIGSWMRRRKALVVTS